MENKDTGLLLNKNNLELQRKYFKEMTKLIGINVIYKAPRDSKDYDLHGELDSKYYEPIKVGCIFDEHPTVWTMKKMGWNSELSDSLSVIHVPYDLEKLQVGALFIIPSGIDNGVGRLFKVIRMSTTMIYPASIACEIGPMYEDEIDNSLVQDFTKSNHNMLVDEADQ